MERIPKVGDILFSRNDLIVSRAFHSFYEVLEVKLVDLYMVAGPSLSEYLVKVARMGYLYRNIPGGGDPLYMYVIPCPWNHLTPRKEFLASATLSDNSYTLGFISIGESMLNLWDGVPIKTLNRAAIPP